MIYRIAETAEANKIKSNNYFKYLLEEIPSHMDDHGVDFFQKICFLGQTSYQWNVENNFNDAPLPGAVVYVCGGYPLWSVYGKGDQLWEKTE